MPLENPYLVFVVLESHWTAYLHTRTGQGRSARRRLVGVWHGEGPVDRKSLPDVLRDVARQMESPVPLRGGNIPQGPGAPGGGGGRTTG